MDDRYRSSEEIRNDMESSRAELHETVNALDRKLTVGRLFDEIWSRFDDRGSAGSAAGAVGDTIRQNPIPLTLVGAGVAWMAIDRATRSEGERLRREYGDQEPGTRRRAEGRRGPYRGDDVDAGDGSGDSEEGDSLTDRARDVAGDAKDWTSDTLADAREAASEATGSAKDRASHAADKAKDMASEGAGTVKQGARRAKRKVSDAMTEQPLALGALAFGLGLAGGLAVPTTSWEDDVLGDASDAVKRETKTVARSVTAAARDVAEDTAKAAKREADRRGVAEDLKDTARSIGEEAKQTARRRAADEDIDAEGIKDRTANAAARAKEGAKEGATEPADRG